ncbi:E3 ubiquitin-protein ligase SDIR1-like [Momordica charantia]|uniref:RING-type E3 ubiquitin transferase n=1 Tax=Momordica charantia TaxID=3673 RepID=A0A6J1CW69_MOMCH|nr:E3 ubiquitin-protein ligase SDIR1-like [Momordica charantia]
MVFNRVFFFFYNFIGFRGRPKLKQKTLLPHGGDSTLRQMVEDESRIPDCVTLSSSGKALEGEMCCCVCLSSIEEGIETSVLPCLHEFHKVCVDRWFEERRRTCPICRYSMEGAGQGNENGTQILTDEMVIWFSSFHTSGF